jgi:hypothetical protein
MQLTGGPYVICDLLILVGIAYDWRTRGKPHPAFVIGLAVTVAVQLARFVVGPTQTWHHFAIWLARLLG